MSRLTWRRQPNETGLRAVCQSERGYELRFGGETVGHVSKTFEDSYYFYGCGKNSLNTGETFKEVAEAKIACKAWVVNSIQFKNFKETL